MKDVKKIKERKLTCKYCKSQFLGYSNRQNCCNTCKEVLVKCSICKEDINITRNKYNNLIKNNSLSNFKCKNCNIKDGMKSRVYNIKCKNCGEVFFSNTFRRFYCNDCRIVSSICQVCNKEFNILRYKYNKDKPKLCSRKCSSIYAANQPRILKKCWCDLCKRETNHFVNGTCCSCNAKSARDSDYKGYCEKCRKETIHYANGGCTSCHGKKIIKMAQKHLKENPEIWETNWIKGFEKIQEWRKNNPDLVREQQKKGRENGAGFKRKFCSMCKRKTIHSGERCSVCEKWGNFFDRDSFYKEKFNLISFDSIEKEISWGDIDSLNEVPGVWSVWASNDKCLDVCQTINIGKEMLAWIRSYNACKDKTDEELIEMNIKHRRYNRKKKRDIAKYCSDLNTKPIFKVISTNIKTKEQREAIESQYAHDNKAIFWNPGLGQKLTKGLHNKSVAFSNKIKI